MAIESAKSLGWREYVSTFVLICVKGTNKRTRSSYVYELLRGLNFEYELIRAQILSKGPIRDHHHQSLVPVMLGSTAGIMFFHFDLS